MQNVWSVLIYNHLESNINDYEYLYIHMYTLYIIYI